MVAPEELYSTSRTDIWVLFYLRDRSAVKSLHLQGGVLQEFGNLASIDEDHYFLLIARPGGARRLEA
jgi:hypothetical protein